MSEEPSWYSKNRERCLELAKAYGETHKEERKAYWKQYYEKNKTEILQKRRTYAKKNKEKIYQNYRKKYYKKNYEKKKEIKKEETTPIPSFSSPPPYRPDFTFTRTTEPVLITWD
jgi:hypothetical protein